MPTPIPPGPGQESVWDYPRPPRLEDTARRIRVILNGAVIADSCQAKRVLETSHPPVYYLPPQDVQMAYFHLTPKATFCEWKGRAIYYTITVGDRHVDNGAWSYPEPTDSFRDIAHYIAVYPGKMEACYVDDEPVQAQPGDFYGGWITSRITGPFKGAPGTWGW